MQIKEEEKRRIIDLHFNEGKTIREVCRIMGKPSHDYTYYEGAQDTASPKLYSG